MHTCREARHGASYPIALHFVLSGVHQFGQTGWPASPRDPHVSAPTQSWDYRCLPPDQIVTWVPEFLHSSMASTSPAEPSPLPQNRTSLSDCSLRPGSLCSCLLSVCPQVFWASPPALLALPASPFVTRSCLVSSQGKWREKGRGLQHTSLKLEANVSSGGEVLLNKHTAVSFISSWQEGRPTRKGKPGRMGREQRWMMGPRIRQGGLGAAVRA